MPAPGAYSFIPADVEYDAYRLAHQRVCRLPVAPPMSACVTRAPAPSSGLPTRPSTRIGPARAPVAGGGRSATADARPVRSGDGAAIGRSSVRHADIPLPRCRVAVRPADGALTAYMTGPVMGGPAGSCRFPARTGGRPLARRATEAVLCAAGGRTAVLARIAFADGARRREGT